MKSRDNASRLTKSWAWFLLLIIYVIPMGFQENFQFFTILRYLFSLGAVFYLIQKPVLPLSSLILFLLFLAKLIFYQELGLDYLYLGLLLILYQNWFYEVFDDLNRMFRLISYLFIAMTLLLTVLARQFPILPKAPIPDRNYAGYFIGFLVIQAFYAHQMRGWLLLVLGILTYSRLFLIAMLFFGIGCALQNILKQRTLSSLFAPLFYGISQMISIIIFYLYRFLFTQINYTYQYHQGFSRFTTLFDASNQLRSQVAIMGFESINPITFFLGLRKGSFAGLSAFAGKTLYPHHTLLVLHVKFGLLTALLYALHFLALFKDRFTDKFAFFIWLITYQIFLGPSIFYGIELLLTLLITQSIIQAKEVCQNAKC